MGSPRDAAGPAVRAASAPREAYGLLHAGTTQQEVRR